MEFGVVFFIVSSPRLDTCTTVYKGREVPNTLNEVWTLLLWKSGLKFYHLVTLTVHK